MSVLTYALLFCGIDPANSAKNEKSEKKRWYPLGKRFFNKQSK